MGDPFIALPYHDERFKENRTLRPDDRSRLAFRLEVVKFTKSGAGK
jgi:hypothetical protein